MSVNKVILLGNVGQPPKVTYYDGGNCVAQVSFATSEKGYTLQNGTQIPDRTEWHNLVFRNRLAEIVDQYVHKGDKLYVEGKIRTRSYDDQTGAKRYVTEIFVDNMENAFSEKCCLRNCGSGRYAGASGYSSTVNTIAGCSCTK